MHTGCSALQCVLAARHLRSICFNESAHPADRPSAFGWISLYTTLLPFIYTASDGWRLSMDSLYSGVFSNQNRSHLFPYLSGEHSFHAPTLAKQLAFSWRPVLFRARPITRWLILPIFQSSYERCYIFHHFSLVKIQVLQSWTGMKWLAGLKGICWSVFQAHYVSGFYHTS